MKTCWHGTSPCIRFMKSGTNRETSGNDMWRKQLAQSEEHAKLPETRDGRLNNRVKTLTSETLK